MEPATQTRVNQWTGFLQEDVYINRTGPIGDFVGNEDVTPNAPLYPIYDQQISNDFASKNCPVNRVCSCIPSDNDPSKTRCGYIINGVKVWCPSDCCTPSCTY